jgi:aspartate/tyrosine/aromatic aminotransferase
MQQPTANDVIEMSSQTDIRQDWENLQQPTERVVIEMLSQTDIRQDWENEDHIIRRWLLHDLFSLVWYMSDLTFR